MVEKQTIMFSSTLSDLCEYNSSFDKGILRIAYRDNNRNKTYISKKVFNDCIHTIYNCPIVCNYQRDKDMIGGHDMQICVRDDVAKIVNITQPVGVVPESAKCWWEEVTEDDGSVHEYICAEALVWKRQEAYAHLKDNGITAQSMEINILGGETKDDGLYHISQFEFVAFCLLERDKPCFESAALELFSHDSFSEQYSEMMNEFKREMDGAVAVIPEMADPTVCPKGGTKTMNLNDLMAKYNIAESDIDFDTKDMTIEEIEARFAAIHSATEEAGTPEGNADEPMADTNNGEAASQGSESEDEEQNGADVSMNYSLTNNQLRAELGRVVHAHKHNHPNYGEISKYWMVDFDADKGEVYVEDSNDYALYGMPFTMNGDTPVVDFTAPKRKKTEYVDWVEGDEDSFTLVQMIQELSQAYSLKIDALNAENKELSEYKAMRMNDDRQKKNDKIFSQFDDLADNEMFAELKERMHDNCNCMTEEELEEKCFSIRGRCVPAKFSLNSTSSRLPVEDIQTATDDEPYGGFFVKYGKNKK